MQARDVMTAPVITVGAAEDHRSVFRELQSMF